MTATTNSVSLGPASQIPPGEGRSFDVSGVQIAVFRVRGKGLQAISAVCSHAGGPLADGQIDGEVVICPLHLNTFELATGCSRSGQPDLTSYPVSEVDGEIVVQVAQP